MKNNCHVLQTQKFNQILRSNEGTIILSEKLFQCVLWKSGSARNLSLIKVKYPKIIGTNSITAGFIYAGANTVIARYFED